MTDKITETDKEVLKRVRADPAVEAMGQKIANDIEKHKLAIVDALRNATPRNAG